MSSTLSPEEVASYRGILDALRARLQGDVDGLTNEALLANSHEASGNLSSVPLHLADLGSENYEQEFTLGLIENDQATLEQIHEAIHRIERGTFGTCQECRGPIPKTRLNAIPYTAHCIGCARQLEGGAR
jgi:RNA polymerase-binding transcription factor DksA